MFHYRIQENIISDLQYIEQIIHNFLRKKCILLDKPLIFLFKILFITRCIGDKKWTEWN